MTTSCVSSTGFHKIALHPSNKFLIAQASLSAYLFLEISDPSEGVVKPDTLGKRWPSWLVSQSPRQAQAYGFEGAMGGRGLQVQVSPAPGTPPWGKWPHQGAMLGGPGLVSYETSLNVLKPETRPSAQRTLERGPHSGERTALQEGGPAGSLCGLCTPPSTSPPAPPLWKASSKGVLPVPISITLYLHPCPYTCIYIIYVSVPLSLYHTCTCISISLSLSLHLCLSITIPYSL